MPDVFVKMEKDGEIIEVHPLVVAAHEAVGWKRVVADQENGDEQAVPVPVIEIADVHVEVAEKAVKSRAKK